MGHTVTRVEHDTRGSAGGVEGKHGLDRDVESGNGKGLKHDLRHALPVRLRVERGLGQQHGVLLGIDSKFGVEGMVPDLLHVIPVGHNSVLQRVLNHQHSPPCHGSVSDILILLACADHNSLRAHIFKVCELEKRII